MKQMEVAREHQNLEGFACEKTHHWVINAYDDNDDQGNGKGNGQMR